MSITAAERLQIEARIARLGKTCEWMCRNAAQAKRFGNANDFAAAKHYAQRDSQEAFLLAHMLKAAATP